MFEKAEPVMDVVRSVTLLHTRYYKVSSSYHSAVPLGVPRHIGIPTPHNRFCQGVVTEGARKHYDRIIPAELVEFENAKASKKLEICVWPVEQMQNASRFRSVHYAFQLQVADV
ncbi:hypothetical protein AAVH_36171 [Aphelenchoides avenae]|nr:hypothetical protein AAVH_36171 [Aphelenchus avenae]